MLMDKTLKRRACARCSVAKAKCIPLAGSDSCERCHRLHRECESKPEPTIKPRKPAKPKTRVAVLESRIDELVNLLQPKKDRQDEPSEQKTVSPEYSGTSSATSSSSSSAGPPLSNSQLPSLFPFVKKHESTFPEQDLAERLFESFKSENLPHFPFLVFPPGMTAAHLQQARPLLWKVIMMVRSFADVDRQVAMGHDIVQNIAMRMLFQGEKSIDLLQSIITFVGWFQYFYLINLQITNLLHLAKALLVHLGMRRDTFDVDRKPVIMEGITADEGDGLRVWNKRNLTEEEFRMLAGCFVLCTHFSSSCNYQDVQLFLPMMESCCQALDSTGIKSDKVASFLIRMSRIMDSAQTIPINSGQNGSLMLADLKYRLDCLWDQASPEVKTDDTFLLYYDIARGALLDVGLREDYDVELVAPTGMSKLELLYGNILVTRSFFDRHTRISQSAFYSQCLIMWAGVNQRIRSSLKLCLLECPGFDLANARQILSVPTVVQAEISRMQGCVSNKSKTSVATMSKDIFHHTSLTLRHILSFYESAIQKMTAKESSLNYEIPFGFSTLDILNSLDDNFWEGVLSNDRMNTNDIGIETGQGSWSNSDPFQQVAVD